MQQIAISGVGGQGVLFLTKVLAEAALDMGLSVLIAETHGMAQRGGSVISHVKIGKREPEHASGCAAPADPGPGSLAGAAACLSGSAPRRFTSPLIRPGKADVLMVLHTEGLATHRHYLKPDGWIFFNSRQPPAGKVQTIDASGIALALCAPVCANLVLLGFAVGSGALFCSPPALETVLRRSGEKALETSVEAFHAGLKLAKAKSHA